MHLNLILLISMVVQMAAAVFALRLIPVTGKRAAWLLISTALLLMSLRRGISYYQIPGMETATLGDPTAEWVALGTSVLMLGGIILIAPLFRSIRHTTAALQQSEAKYRELVENANSIILRLDPQGRITFFNEYAQGFFGYSSEEILGQPAVGTIVSRTDRKGRNLAARITDLVQHPERYPTQEMENLRKNGDRVWINWSHKAVQDTSGRLVEILCVGNDSTTCKRAQEALNEQYWLLEAFVQHTITPMAFLQPDFTLTRVNAALAQVCQREIDTFPGQSLFYFFLPADQALLEQVPQTRKPCRAFATPFTFPRQPERGVTYWDWTLVPILDHAGEMKFLVFSLKEVTERHQAAAELQRSEEKYRQLVRNIPALVFRGYQDWTVDFFDNKIEELIGFPKEDFDSRRLKWSDLIVAEDLQLAQQPVVQAMKGRRSYVREYRITSKDGKVLWIQERGQVIYNPAGKFDYISGVFYDITHQKETEEALLASEEQLRQAQKMEAVGRLAGGVAHDFNNLLTGIIGYTELMLVSLDKHDPLRSDLEEIKKAGERAASLTRQLLAFSRKQILQPQKLNLNSIIRDMEKLLQRLIGEDIHLVAQMDGNLGFTEADPSQLEQVIINLVVNSRDAMPQGGELTIETANVELDESYTYRDVNFLPGPYVMLSVSDNGSGMDQETLSNIFEPFFTTKGRDQGTGLGLATVYGIVKQSGGFIWVYSEPQWGTTFKIYLPRVASVLEAARPQPEPAVPSGGWETVLLVEDEEVVRDFVFSVLQKSGYQVLTARDGQEALALCAQYREPIHLLLTDVVMPGLSGRELAERLPAQYPEIRVLFITGYAENAIHRHGVLDPGLALLTKPFSPAALAQKVRKVLDAPSLAASRPGRGVNTYVV